MKTSALIVSAAALVFAAGSPASNVGSPPYQLDEATLLLDPSASRKPVYHDSRTDRSAKVRRDRQRCAKNEEQCEDED